MDSIDNKWQCPTCFAWHEFTVKVCTPCRLVLWNTFCLPQFQLTDPARLKQTNLKKVMAWAWNPQGMILFGNTGTGKTRTAMLLMHREFDAGRTIDVFIGARFSNECSRVFYDNEGENWLDKLVKTDLVLLDDLDKMKMTQCVQWALYCLLDTRINYCRPTIITTNMTSKLLMQRFDPQFRDALDRRLHEFFIPILFE